MKLKIRKRRTHKVGTPEWREKDVSIEHNTYAGTRVTDKPTGMASCSKILTVDQLIDGLARTVVGLS